MGTIKKTAVYGVGTSKDEVVVLGATNVSVVAPGGLRLTLRWNPIGNRFELSSNRAMDVETATPTQMLIR